MIVFKVSITFYENLLGQVNRSAAAVTCKVREHSFDCEKSDTCIQASGIKWTSGSVLSTPPTSQVLTIQTMRKSNEKFMSNVITLTSRYYTVPGGKSFNLGKGEVVEQRSYTLPDRYSA